MGGLGLWGLLGGFLGVLGLLGAFLGGAGLLGGFRVGFWGNFFSFGDFGSALLGALWGSL